MALITVTLSMVRPFGSEDIPLPATGRVEFTPVSHGKYAGAFRTIETVTRPILNGIMEPAELTPGAWTLNVRPIKGTAWPEMTFVLESDASGPVNVADLTPDIIYNGLQLAKGDPGRGIASVSDANSNSIVTITYTDGTTSTFKAPKGDKGDPPTITWSGTRIVVNGTTGPDLKGASGPAPTVSWVADRLVVGGQTGPALTGAKGDTGAPGAVPTASDQVVVGPGRPDVPSSTGFTSAQLTALPVGCEFRSSDGAAVNAWVWRKRAGNTWVVVDGDTKWRRVPTSDWSADVIPVLHPDFTHNLEIRRTGETIDFFMRLRLSEVKHWVAPYLVPSGFRFKPNYPVAATVHGLDTFDTTFIFSATDPFHYFPHANTIRYPGGMGANASVIVRGVMISGSWTTSDPWPLTLPGAAAGY